MVGEYMAYFHEVHNFVFCVQSQNADQLQSKGEGYAHAYNDPYKRMVETRMAYFSKLLWLSVMLKIQTNPAT